MTARTAPSREQLAALRRMLEHRPMITAFIVGLFVGATVGLLVAGLCQMARDS
jgi:hypothetical protein